MASGESKEKSWAGLREIPTLTRKTEGRGIRRSYTAEVAGGQRTGESRVRERRLRRRGGGARGLVCSSTFQYILCALSFLPAGPRPSPGFHLTRTGGQAAFHGAKSRAQPPFRASENTCPRPPPAECRRGPGRWWPCSPFAQTAAFDRTPTELLSPKPRSWPSCRNRPFST